MKPIMTVLMVLFMTFAMLSIAEAGWLPANGEDAYVPGHLNPYPCIVSPAYTHYTDAKNGTCPAPEKRKVTPEPMGSPGI